MSLRRVYLQHIPPDREVLGDAIARMKENHGVDLSSTAGWISEFRSEEQLKRAVLSGWAATTLPLRDWSRRIAQVGFICDASNAYVGVYLRLDRPRLEFVQQAPMTAVECRARLQDLIGDAPRMLLELFCAAPGLRAAAGPVIALPDFIRRPMEAAAVPGHSIEECFRGDLPVWTRAQCACELVRAWPAGPEQQLIALAHDGTPFLYVDDETPALTELTIGISELVSLYFEHPVGVLSRTMGYRKTDGRTIDFTIPGKAARERFADMPEIVQLALGIRAARRLIARRDEAPEWDSVEEVLDRLCEAISSERRPSPELLEAIVLLLHRSSYMGNDVAEPVSLIGYLHGLVTAYDRNCRPEYPYIALKRGADCEPVYRSMARDLKEFDAHQERLTDPLQVVTWLLSLPL